ncbi:MAG: hypothetical protein R3B09_09285 [Nannocystaceae bacterium]
MIEPSIVPTVEPSAPSAALASFASFMVRRDAELTVDAIVEHLEVRRDGLGPIALGEPDAAVLDRLGPDLRSLNGVRLDLQPDHHAQPGYASGTVAHLLSAHGFGDWLPCERQCWLEWAADEVTGTVVQVRFCVRVMLSRDGGLDELVARLRTRFEATLGPGVERRKKHRRSRVRPVDWAVEDATLTLGSVDRGSWRYVIAELTANAWIDRSTVRLEAFR